jgi:hypothetical protein
MKNFIVFLMFLALVTPAHASNELGDVFKGKM